MKPYLLLFLCLLNLTATAQTESPQRTGEEMTVAAKALWQSLTAEQRTQACLAHSDWERQTWDYTPHDRKGLTLRQMQPTQRQLVWGLLKTSLSESGYTKAEQIVDLENVLRVVENRPANDTYRDPDGYYLTLFGEPGGPSVWGWRFEGHHLSLHFSSLMGRVIGQTPLFMGSNPGVVRVDVPQKGRDILREETELAFTLLNSLSVEQRTQAILRAKAFGDVLTGNSRRASLDRMDGIPYTDMTPTQQTHFLAILKTYLNRYRVTLAQQQLDRLEQIGLGKLHFAWAGSAERGDAGGYYYRIHGPTFLIEYDNTQNDANHVHTVVRDLTNDFGEDMLRAHYENKR